MQHPSVPGKLSVQQLRHSVGEFVLAADFEVEAGDRAALLGPNGSGKSTLLRLIAGLDPLEEGRIVLGGRDITRATIQSRKIGMVFQDLALFPSLDLLQNAVFGLRMQGVSKTEREKEGMRWLEMVGLASRAKDSVDRLSGGERQRVAIVRALLGKPELLLLDEPFSALDQDSKIAMRQELVRLHQLLPVPLLFVTHDPADVIAVANSRLELETDARRAIHTVRKTGN